MTLFAGRINSTSAFTPSHQGYVWTMAALDNGLVASGGRDCVIRLWDDLGRARGQLRGHSQSVLGLAVLGEGRVASVSRDRSLRLWDTESGACELVVAAHDAAILSVAALPRGLIASGGADGQIKIWENNGALLTRLDGSNSWVWGLVALDETQLAAACEDGQVIIWDYDRQHRVQTLIGDKPLRTVAVSPVSH